MPSHADAGARPRLAPLLALAVTLIAGLSWAERAEARVATTGGARARLEAQSLIALGRYGEACDKLEESQRREPALTTQWGLADCWGRAGRVARAWELYQELAAESASSTEAKRLATARAAALEPRLAHLQVHVAAAHADGLHVSVDGVTVPRRRWGGDLRVDVGRHRVSAEAPGRQPWERVVQVSAGGTRTRIEVPALEVGASVIATDTPRPSPGPMLASVSPTSDAPAPPSYTGAYVAGGIGLAGLTVGALSGWLASSKMRQARGLCAGKREGCPPSFKDDREALKRYAENARQISYVALGVGAAGLVAGAALMYVTRKKELDQTEAITISPSVGTSGVGVSLSGSF